MDNALRGALAEYIVACDLGVANGTRPGWNAYDLKTPEGIKVEVKSAAYLQSWQQKRALEGVLRRTTHFTDGTPRRTPTVTKRKRQADVYVFCLLAHKDKATLDPLDLSQWEFYALSSRVLDEKLPTQKTINLAGLLRLGPVKMEFGGIRNTIKDLFR